MLKRLAFPDPSTFTCYAPGMRFLSAKQMCDYQDEVRNNDLLVGTRKRLRTAMIPLVALIGFASYKHVTVGFTFAPLTVPLIIILVAIAALYWLASEWFTYRSNRKLKQMEQNGRRSVEEANVLADEFLGACNVVYNAICCAESVTRAWNIYARRVGNGSLRRVKGYDDDALQSEITELHDAVREMDEFVGQLYRDHDGLDKDRAMNRLTDRPNRATLTYALNELRTTPAFELVKNAEVWHSLVMAKHARLSAA